MLIEDVKALLIDEVKDSLPYRVTLIGKEGNAYGAGETLSGALMRVFHVSNLFPTPEFPLETKKELARFLFWNFDASPSWVRAIRVLEQEGEKR